MLVHVFRELEQIVLFNGVAFNFGDQDPSVFIRQTRQDVDQGQGDHPLHQVLSKGFPKVLFIGRVIEPVVGQLKGNAQV